VATSSQTNFSGADADGATLAYDIGNGSCQVWLNGIRLDRSDVTATDGTSVVLAACTTGDIVHIQATQAFTPADVVSASSGGTFASAITVSGDVTGTTINATGDTSAGDNAAIGYTAAEGLILTGQGSTSDVTIKNDADADVITIPTGGKDVALAADVTVGTLVGAGASSKITLYSDSAARSEIISDGSTSDLVFKNNSTEYMRLKWAGGLTFGGDTAAANGLSDYESGTWTPTTTGFDGTMDNVEGDYVKIGKLVYIYATVRTSATSDDSSYQITGLPFTSHGNSYAHFPISQGYNETTTHPIYPVVGENSNGVFFYTKGPSHGSGDVLSFTEMTAGTQEYLSIAGCYPSSDTY